MIRIANFTRNFLSVLTTLQLVTQIAFAQTWAKLTTEPFPGKQDDICFVDENTGWYINGAGKIYRTTDGGDSWVLQLHQPGTFFRCVAFIDSLRGFAGTVGTDYFPNVTDTIPLYRTLDGGKSWSPVDYTGPYVKGLCAIDIVKESYINHGRLDYKYHIWGVGRVGGPAMMLVSHDSGNTFLARDLNASAQMLFDVKMLDLQTGIACAASSANITQSNALILRTQDGGKTWTRVYQSSRPMEITWKASFPTPLVGYVTIQSYNPDPAASRQRIAKTTDGGKTWQELDLCDDLQARSFGVGFLNADHGYVGTMNSGYETRDGGRSWSKIGLGRACNKIRIYQDEGKTYGYAIGVDVFKLQF